jgi:predicted RNase H-like HicB family nuclease
MKLKVVLEKGLDGYIVVSCPALKGCVSQGRTEEEALKNIKEAIALYLEADPHESAHRPEKYKVFEVSL